jgi:hypothetical protein
VSASILTHFAPLEKPRIERNKLHALSDRVCLTVCAGVRRADRGEVFGRGEARVASPRRAVPERRAFP